jgi:hypothetical protein
MTAKLSGVQSAFLAYLFTQPGDADIASSASEKPQKQVHPAEWFEVPAFAQHPGTEAQRDSAIGGHQWHGEEHTRGPVGCQIGHQHHRLHRLGAQHDAKLHAAGGQPPAVGLHLRGVLSPRTNSSSVNNRAHEYTQQGDRNFAILL